MAVKVGAPKKKLQLSKYIYCKRKDNEHTKFCVLAGKKLSKQEDLKEMGDISSGMSSSIMQLYLKQVLEAFFHTQSSVRHFALNVIALTLNQGLIHPVQVRHESQNLLATPKNH